METHLSYGVRNLSLAGAFMNLLIVACDSAFRDFLRLSIADHRRGEIPNAFEAATLKDALGVVRTHSIDAVLCDKAFPADWGEGMGDRSEWHKNAAILKSECAVREVPCVLLRGDTFANPLMASGMIERYLSEQAMHEKVVDQ
jgi:hypothetical protein